MSQNKIYPIDNAPDAFELWAGIGGHFDNLSQIINEFLDNSISNFQGNNLDSRNILISLEELSEEGNVKIVIEDSGTGIKDINHAFTLGSQKAGETPLNEHGFGLKHALASANPENNSWAVYTRTQEDIENNRFQKISAPYRIKDFSGIMVEDEPWPGTYNSTGTIVEFICSREMFKTLTKGIQGGMKDFYKIADVLCEDIGFVYSGAISSNGISIRMVLTDCRGESRREQVGALTPDWDNYIDPGQGKTKVDLGGGDVEIKYQFGSMNDKASREEFNNDTSKKHYKKNMSSSGVEIRINGRVICHNLFTEIWDKERHNSFNHLLVIVDIISSDKDKLPQTRTSKNGLREGGEKIEKLFGWIKQKMPSPPKDISLATHETDLFEELKENINQYNKDESKVVTTEQRVFDTGNTSDLVRIDLYCNIGNKTTIYEGKRNNTTSKDVYQLRMYWDGLVYEKIPVHEAKLVAVYHPDSVKSLIEVVNTMKDANGDNYNIVTTTWKDEGLNID